MSEPESPEPPEPPARPSGRTRKPLGQSIGGVLFGFEQQVLRTMPPPQELVHHARPDDPVPAGDGTLLSITLPVDQPAIRPADGAVAPPDPDPEAT